MQNTKLKHKLNESLQAVLPIVGIVLILSFTIVPIPTSILLAFLLGTVLLISGMMLFSLGAEMAMEPIGEKLGAKITRTKKVWLILVLGFLLGFMITIAEPDLQVLANQVTAIPNNVLILAVAAGVGLFLVSALLRMLLDISLRLLLIIFYAAVFVLAIFAPGDFLAVAFDSGGVTTGPMTVPFIMAFGIGISAIRSDKHASDDSFGLIALCSIGPILAVLILSLIYHPEAVDYSSVWLPDAEHSVELGRLFWQGFPTYMKEMFLALIPVTAFFFVFQIFSLKLDKKPLESIVIGLVYTYVGLVLFLTGVNVGFMPAGSFLGQSLAALDYRIIIVPLGMLIGFFIVKAEPAVYVLMKQVEEITSGSVSGKALQRSLSIGVAVSVGLAMIRVLSGISILYFLVPGYATALVLSFFVPKIFTAIAFDSGGVASGPMTATFLLPFATGACMTLGGNVVTDAFGIIAMVAMTPLITIQILGILYQFKSKSTEDVVVQEDSFAELSEYAIIEL